MQPAEIEISQTVECGSNIIGCGTTVSQVLCEYLSYEGTTTETSYVVSNLTYDSVSVASTTMTTIIYSDSTITDVVTTGVCLLTCEVLLSAQPGTICSNYLEDLLSFCL